MVGVECGSCRAAVPNGNGRKTPDREQRSPPIPAGLIAAAVGDFDGVRIPALLLLWA